MSTAEDNVLSSLLNGLTRDDQASVLRSIQDTRELHIEQKLHPRRRRRRGEGGLLEPLTEESSVPEQAGADMVDVSETPDGYDLSESSD